MSTKNKDVNNDPVQEGDAPYKGTVRIVTEADILADPRLVAASAVVGQLYDFSNLPKIKDGVLEANVTEMNRKRESAEESKIAKADINTPTFTSEQERLDLGIASDEEIAAAKARDEATQKRIDEKTEIVENPPK